MKYGCPFYVPVMSHYRFSDFIYEFSFYFWAPWSNLFECIFETLKSKKNTLNIFEIDENSGHSKHLGPLFCIFF